MSKSDFLYDTIEKHKNHNSIKALYDTIEKHKNHNSFKAILERYKCNETFEFKQVDIDFVYKLLCKLIIHKATGYDNMPLNMVKIYAEELTELVNYAFKKNRCPDDVKRAEISPIFKKNYILKDNYRPISILSIFAKIFETIVADKLMEYFKSIFNDMLCAYRKKYGTDYVLIKLIDSWKCALDENKFVGTVLMDLSKAFDCISHGLLIAKMKAYWLSNYACEFMAIYLSDRYQRVKISNNKNSWMPLLKGIPQGSSLGPFLFNIFMNDISYFIETCSVTKLC